MDQTLGRRERTQSPACAATCVRTTHLNHTLMSITSLRLVGDREIHLDAVHIAATYRSILMGAPSPGLDDELLSEISSPARRLWPEVPIWVVRPVRATTNLPKYSCAGRFVCYYPAHDTEYDGSTLVMIWFQDSVDCAISAENMDLIARVDWNNIAKDFAW